MFCQCNKFCTSKANVGLEIEGKVVYVQSTHVSVNGIFAWNVPVKYVDIPSEPRLEREHA